MWNPVLPDRTFYIPFNVPSLKNSKIKTEDGIFPSKTVTKYLSNLGVKSYSTRRREVENYKTKPNLLRGIFKDFKIDTFTIIKFHFIRDSKRRFDFNNANQIILDLLTAHKIIPDDDMDWVIPIPLKIKDRWYSVDKETAGVIIMFE